MRSYGQFCALAKALDVVGDRWSLLIVRELLVRGRCRYTDLRHGLPGIATNLLADRLRDLEDADVVRRVEGSDAPSAAYELTERGHELQAAIHELGRWGAPLMPVAGEDDAFRSHWLVVPIEISLADRSPEQPPIAIEIRSGDDSVVMTTANGEVRAQVGTVARPDGILSGPPKPVLGLLLGSIALEDAVRMGVTYDGSRRALRRITRI